MTALFNTILYTPLFNLLIFLYDLIPGHDFGVAIIALTVLVRVIFSPLSIKAQRSQRALNALNPQIKEIKEKLKNDQTAQGAAIMKLYKEHGVNPVAGCLPLLIQLPILIALYRAFIAGLNPQSLTMLYPFVHNPGALHTAFLGFITTTAHNRYLAVVAGGLQYLQARQSSNYMKSSGMVAPEMSALNNQMLYFFPIFIVIIGWNLPAGLILYWITTTLFSVVEQLYLKKTS